MRAFISWSRLFAVGAVVVAIVGCGGRSGPARVAVNGQVELDGRPAPDGAISFQPLGPGAGPAAVASLKEGRYGLTNEEGPLAGRHRVTLVAAPSGKQLPLGANGGAAPIVNVSAPGAGRWQTEVNVPEGASCELAIRFETPRLP